MSCCEKTKYDRLKQYKHSAILACQSANVTGINYCIIIDTHRQYGKYYNFIPYAKAKKADKKIIKVFKKGDKTGTRPRSVAATLK